MYGHEYSFHNIIDKMTSAYVFEPRLCSMGIENLVTWTHLSFPQYHFINIRL